ncbi:MAG: hypothetical protein ACXVP7_11885 [Actinomycetota bacterium]
MRRRSPTFVVASAFTAVAAAALLAGGCGGGGSASGNQAATATTFATDAVVNTAMLTMVTQAHNAALFATSDRATAPAAACASAWDGVRDKVTSRDPKRAAVLDRAVAALEAGARARDTAATGDAAATIATNAAAYARLFP